MLPPMRPKRRTHKGLILFQNDLYHAGTMIGNTCRMYKVQKRMGKKFTFFVS